MVRGTLKSGGKTFVVDDGRLKGDEITFKINNEKYAGKVNGNSILGTMEDSSKGTKSDWMATKRN
jgi:hypothetical protein